MKCACGHKHTEHAPDLESCTASLAPDGYQPCPCQGFADADTIARIIHELIRELILAIGVERVEAYQAQHGVINFRALFGMVHELRKANEARHAPA